MALKQINNKMPPEARVAQCHWIFGYDNELEMGIGNGNANGKSGTYICTYVRTPGHHEIN